ncbi:hypothetical protein [Natrinema marinum]|uniref:hypothetical protein n=1 Tax=Natrinema marinum TaxID=2961598 RepID=UPI0020C89629|nr:hypothetical protein [Natrinema marinum]
MEEIALHTGTEHPNLLWILGPALLTFVAGLGLGAAAYADRIRSWLRPERETTRD